MRSNVEKSYCGDKFFLQADVLALYSKVIIKKSCCIYYSVKKE